jgi:exopolysaccharide production protein ExoZ
MGENRKSRFEGIQVLRVVAALLVVVTHTTFYASERLDPGFPVWRFGAIGVDIFFTISGFVMMVATGSLTARSDGWKFFLMRRAVRIAPMYWIATTVKLLTLIAIPSVVLHASLNWGNIALSYFFLPSRNIDGSVEPLLGVGWTLIFEVFFYFVFALALRLRINVLYFSAAILTTFSLLTLVRPAGDWAPILVYFDPIVMYFLAGIVIAKYTQDGSVRGLIGGLSFVLGVIAIVEIVQASGGNALDRGHVLRAVIVVALTLVVVLLERFNHHGLPRVLLFFGAASYSLYLFHPLIAPLIPVILAKIGLVNAPLSVVASVAVVLLASALLYRLAEKPLTDLLNRRLPYVRPQAPAAVKTDPGHARTESSTR